MKLLGALKYILNSASYGVVIAVTMLLLIPELRETNSSWFDIFEPTSNNPHALSYAKAVRASSPAVVNIYSEEVQTSPNYANSPRKTTVLGSGVIMMSNGFILTNYHVIQNATLINVLLQNGQLFHAEVIGFDRYTDLAVLKVDAINLPVIPQNHELEPLAGDIVLAIGNPLNLGQTITQGIISATGRSGLSTSYLEFLQIDAAINTGNSGGALVNSNGVLIGINSLKFSELNPNNNIQGISFAVPYKLADKIMMKIIENGRVIRGWLGVVSRNYNQTFKGFTITAVEANSPAHKSGLKAGDIVYQIGDTPIESTTQALDIVAETRPGTQLTFKVYRNKQSIDVNVLILEKKPT